MEITLLNGDKLYINLRTVCAISFKKGVIGFLMGNCPTLTIASQQVEEGKLTPLYRSAVAGIDKINGKK